MADIKTVEKYEQSEQELMKSISDDKDAYHASVTFVNDDMDLSFAGSFMNIVEGITYMLEDLLSASEKASNQEVTLTFGRLIGMITDLHTSHVLTDYSEGFLEQLTSEMENMDADDDGQSEGGFRA